MSAIQTAILLYGNEFSRVHGLYSQYGYVYSEPNCIALARPCIMDDYISWCKTEDADAWWIEFVCGPGALHKLLGRLPFDLPRIGWVRGFKGKDNPRFYELNRLKKAINGLS